MNSLIAPRTIFLAPSKCNGCGDCMVACSMRRIGRDRPEHSCIQVLVDEGGEDFHLPLLCMQCSDPPCLAACPREAIYRDDGLNRVMINQSLCVGCRMCFEACPFGAMGFDEDRGRAFKCDLCGGEPECVRRCEPAALTFIDVSLMKTSSLQAVSERFDRAMGGK